MAVNLSPIWGAGAQLLDNSGNVLSGGKIYTYAAGTTTQVATYTSNSGNVANSNPIVLNSAGRVPYEIWLTDGQNYKFVLKDSNDVLIGTWDNLSGINSNFIAYTNQQEIQTATAGQTVFNLVDMQYLPGTNSLSVFVDGVNQYGPGAQYAYEETDLSVVTFASGLHVGAEVKFTSSQIQNAGVTDASQVSYVPPFTDSVATNVEAKLAQSVSVKDFGAVGDGITNDVAAIEAAIVYANANAPCTIVFPSGTYNVKAGLTQKITANDVHIDGQNSFFLCETGNVFNFDGASLIYRNSVNNCKFSYTVPTVSTAATPIVANECLYFQALNIYVTKAPAVITLTSVSNWVLNGVFGETMNVARPAISLVSCVVGNIDNVSLITTAGLQPIDPATPYPDPPVSGNMFIKVTGTTTDTLRIGTSVLCNRFYYGFYSTIAAGQTLLNVWMSNVVYDYCYAGGIYIENTGGSISNVNMDNLYVQAMQGNGIEIYHNAASGLTQNITINNPEVLLSGYHSIYLHSSTYVSIYNSSINNPYIVGGNRLSGTGKDIYCVKAIVDTQGGSVGWNGLALLGYNCQADVGVYYDDCEIYNVSNITSGGLTNSYVFTNDPSSNYAGRLVCDNKTIPGESVSTLPDYATISSTAVVSGATYTNTTAYKQNVTIYGTSTTGTATITLNGITVCAHTEWSGIMYPGDALVVTTATSSNRVVRNLP